MYAYVQLTTLQIKNFKCHTDPSDPLLQEREGSGELRVQAVSHHIIQYHSIMLQYLVT